LEDFKAMSKTKSNPFAVLKPETQKWLEHFEAARALNTKTTLTEKDVITQVKALRTPGGINTRKITDYIERQLTPSPLTPSGVPRGFPMEWSAEFDASVRSMKQQPLAKVAESRRLALTLENCRDFREVLNHVSDFRNKDEYGPTVIFWLRVKILNINFLYGNYPNRSEYFLNSEYFRMVVWGLIYGFYEGYFVDQNGKLIQPEGKQVINPETSITAFPKSEPAAVSISAKPRD
jgi:hypothetical protein